MQDFARSKGMEVIPLVQTFGHMEVRQTSYLPAVYNRNACKFLDGVPYHIMILF